MANKPVAKFPINKIIFMQMLKDRELTLRRLEKLPDFDYSTKSVARALKNGYMSYTLANSLAHVLGMSTSSFILNQTANVVE